MLERDFHRRIKLPLVQACCRTEQPRDMVNRDLLSIAPKVDHGARTFTITSSRHLKPTRPLSLKGASKGAKLRHVSVSNGHNGKPKAGRESSVRLKRKKLRPQSSCWDEKSKPNVSVREPPTEFNMSSQSFIPMDHSYRQENRKVSKPKMDLKMDEKRAKHILTNVVGYKHPYRVVSRSYFPDRDQQIKRSKKYYADKRRNRKLHSVDNFAFKDDAEDSDEDPVTQARGTVVDKLIEDVRESNRQKAEEARLRELELDAEVAAASMSNDDADARRLSYLYNSTNSNGSSFIDAPDEIHSSNAADYVSTTARKDFFRLFHEQQRSPSKLTRRKHCQSPRTAYLQACEKNHLAPVPIIDYSTRSRSQGSPRFNGSAADTFFHRTANMDAADFSGTGTGTGTVGCSDDDDDSSAALLKVLDYSNYGLGEGRVKALAAFLRTCDLTPTAMLLRDNGLQQKGVLAILQAMRQNECVCQDLREWDLAVNRVGTKGCNYIAEMLIPPEFQALPLPPPIAKYAKTYTLGNVGWLQNLQCLDLSDNKLGDRGVRALLHILTPPDPGKGVYIVIQSNTTHYDTETQIICEKYFGSFCFVLFLLFLFFHDMT